VPARLLVSVRNLAEARSALEAGCDVLDLKEPAAGPLGMVKPAAIVGICDFVRAARGALPVSVALGEALDWAFGRPLPAIPSAISYFKLGTAHLGGSPGSARPLASAVAQWKNAFCESARHTLAVSRPPEAIAVAYADFERASAPAPEEVIREAAFCGCTGVLIDTCDKSQGRLIDSCDAEQLKLLAAQARKLRLTFALAGSLRISDLPELCAVEPDLIGIRSAACRGGQRGAEIDPAAVRAFRRALASPEVVVPI